MVENKSGKAEKKRKKKKNRRLASDTRNSLSVDMTA
jgi:hypothetical protein